MNKQPFYHRATILFTGLKEFSEEEIRMLIQEALMGQKSMKGVLDPLVIIEDLEVEPGDPYDLM